MNFSIKNTLSSSSQLTTVSPVDKYTPDTRISTNMLSCSMAGNIGTRKDLAKLSDQDTPVQGSKVSITFRPLGVRPPQVFMN